MRDDDELPKTRPNNVSRGPASTELDTLPVELEGRYSTIEGAAELGRGGMGRVLRLYDTNLRREVAVKELLPEHANEKSSIGPLIGSLFIREARVMARQAPTSERLRRYTESARPSLRAFVMHSPMALHRETSTARRWP